MNTLVTSVHVILILAYTVLSVLTDNVGLFNGQSGYTVSFYTCATAWTFCGALMDIFLAYMMFFILDGETHIDILRDENNLITYAVLDVIKSDGQNDASFE
jgi:hypothetical protein